MCLPAAGPCDVAEICRGDAPQCPAEEVLDGIPCSNGDLCNGDEIFEAGVCVGGTSLVCHDADACTTDSCDAIQGGGYDPIPDCGLPVPST